MHDLNNDQQQNKDSNPVETKTNPFTEKEFVPLVSKGIFYPAQWKGIEKILIRKLNWEDEDLLTTKSYYENGTLFNEILKNCIIDDSKLSWKLLTNADKDAILCWLRICAFGPEYSVKYKCRKCGHTDKVTWNLTELIMPEYPQEILDEIAKGSLTITLPDSGLKVDIIPGTIGREQEIQKNLEQKKQKTSATKDFNVTGKLLSIIKTAYTTEGQPLSSSDEIYSWLRTGNNGSPLSLNDSRTIREEAKKIDLMLDTKKDIICTNCNHIEENVDMPMTINFFYPSLNL